MEVYAKLKWLAENTKAQLQERNMLKDEIGLVLDQIIDIQDTLMNVSVKELTNQDITDEENLKLYRYGGLIDSVIQIMQMNLMRNDVDTSNDFTTALIADVSTIAPNDLFPKGTYLEIGNGTELNFGIIYSRNQFIPFFNNIRITFNIIISWKRQFYSFTYAYPIFYFQFMISYGRIRDKFFIGIVYQ